MEKLKLEHNAVIKSIDTTKEGVLIIKGIASMYRTPEGFLQIDRDNELVNTDFMDLESYKKNPILVFQHDWNRPMGKVTEIDNSNGALNITAEVYKLPGEENIYEAVQKGIIKSLSISTVPHSMVYRDTMEGDVLEIESSTLVEISLTTVQSNQEALFDVVAEKSPTISKRVLAAQNGMTCDELDGSCAFKTELKGKSINLEKETKMTTITKEIDNNAPKEPETKEPAKEADTKEPTKEADTKEADTKEADTKEADTKEAVFDENALVAAIELAEVKKAELAEQKAQEAAQREADEKAKAAAEAKAKAESALDYIKERREEIIAIPDEEFDTDGIEDFYELITETAEAIEEKVVGVIKSTQSENSE